MFDESQRDFLYRNDQDLDKLLIMDLTLEVSLT